MDGQLRAPNLVLTGRSGASSEEAKETIAELQRQGTNVVVVQADITLADDVERLLAQIHETLPPLRGIIHAAMVLDDEILLKLDAARFRKVMAPKVDGAWHLHQATVRRPNRLLRFVLVDDSVVGQLGPKQLLRRQYVPCNARSSTQEKQPIGVGS